MQGYRTFFVNFALMAVALSDYFIANGSIVGTLVSDPKKAVLIVAGVNVVNIVMRFFTTTAPGKKSE